MSSRPSRWTATGDDDLLWEQVAYYRARAPEYDEWFERRGRYDRGPEVNAAWQDEAAIVRAALDTFAPRGDVLEIAGGTGLWTQHLAAHASTLTVLDSAPEMLAANQTRSEPLCRERGVPLDLVRGDVFRWRPAAGCSYDVVFFGFWLSHVPDARFDAFWATVRRWLRPGGRVFFVDSRFAPTSIASDHPIPDPAGSVAVRRLNDGRTYRIVKRFLEPQPLAARLTGLGWRVEVGATETFFLHGQGGPA